MIQITEYSLSHLNAMFGYNTPVPDVPVTYSHRLGIFDKGYLRREEHMKVIEKKRAVKDPNKLKDSEKRVLQIVNCNKGVTGVEVAKKTKWTANHCSMMLTALYRRGLITRTKQREAGTRWYIYHARKV
jgi:uncharacterized membrane protein